MCRCDVTIMRVWEICTIPAPYVCVGYFFKIESFIALNSRFRWSPFECEIRTQHLSLRSPNQFIEPPLSNSYVTIMFPRVEIFCVLNCDVLHPLFAGMTWPMKCRLVGLYFLSWYTWNKSGLFGILYCVFPLFLRFRNHSGSCLRRFLPRRDYF